MTLYSINVRPVRPAGDDRGVVYEIEAKTPGAARKEAKRRARWVDMTYDRLDGRLTATVMEEE